AAAPGLVLGVRVSADSPRAPAIAETAVAEGVDFLSAALGDSSTYLGSARIVPPPPVEEDAIASLASGFRLGPPLIATSRVVDPARAAALVAEGIADAVGMTRALIADPELPAKTRRGAIGAILRCVGCNVCIAHYHAGTPIACAVNPRTGRERTLARERAGRRRRVVVVGAGPAGLAAAAESAEAGHEVVLLERSPRLGGQMALALETPGGGATARELIRLFERRLRSVDVRLGVAADARVVAGLEPDVVVVATGAQPYTPPLDLGGVRVAQAWDVLVEAPPEGLRVLVADWGGDPAGLDCAEMLAAAGNEVTLAVASVAVGETVHQYRRNLYLERLYRAGVEVLHHRALAGSADGLVELANVFAPELRERREVDLLVLAQGRVPLDEVAPALRAVGLRVEEAGDCLSPRSLEEAILEGTLAVQRIGALA
ncbi:MAG: FAD-dependent oxidoreductase, partial [Gaiellaceae bacterium]|nr:FAD-dependent oxidoreductase [Gaiellaceae bacterium]